MKTAVIQPCCVLFSIYAIGDCIHGPMLAHKAEDEGLSSVIYPNLCLQKNTDKYQLDQRVDVDFFFYGFNTVAYNSPQVLSV